MRPSDQFDRLLMEAVTRSADHQAALERADLSRRTGVAVTQGIVEVLVAAGVLRVKE